MEMKGVATVTATLIILAIVVVTALAFDFTNGFSAPVAMEVAIALAVSWKPLVKSKARAVTTTCNNLSVLKSE